MTDGNTPIFCDQDRGEIRAAADKPLVYLDSCVWIDVAERCEALSRQCSSVVNSGKALFPVSFATVAEVLEQPTAVKRLRVATLMDELSKGVCFRSSKWIHEMEADRALPIILGTPEIAFEREQLLTWIVEFAATMSLRFPPSWNRAKADGFTRLLAQAPELRSVRWLVDHSAPGQMRHENAERMERYVREMTAGMARRSSFTQHLSKDARWQELLFEERASVAKRLISPRMSKNLMAAVGPEKLLGTMVAISGCVGEGGQQRLDRIMKGMPSLDIYCHIIAERSRNHSRKVRPQDFFDVEHAVVGGIYADFFVTMDGNLFDLLTHRCGISARCGCRVLQGIKGLEEALTEIAS